MFLHPDLLTQEMVDARNNINKEAEIFYAMTTDFMEKWVGESILKVDGNPKKKFKDQFDSLMDAKIKSASFPLGIVATYSFASISVELNTYIQRPRMVGVEFFKSAFIAGFHRGGMLESTNKGCDFKTDFTKDGILELLKERTELRDRLSTVESTLTRFMG